MIPEKPMIYGMADPVLGIRWVFHMVVANKSTDAKAFKITMTANMKPSTFRNPTSMTFVIYLF